jgi:hypothetical protein
MRILGFFLGILTTTSCLKTDVLNAPIEQADTVLMRKPHRPLLPPIEEDTTRITITFNPSVEDWEENDINL